MNNQIVGKLPPQSIETEQSLLGCLLIDKDSIIKIADFLQPNDFYKESHELIFEAMKELYAKQEPIDILTLSSRLMDKGHLEKIGGRGYLAEISNSVATSSHVVFYANIVQRKATLRRLLNVAAQLSEMGYTEEEDIEQVLDQAEQRLFSVSQKFTKNAFLPIDSLLAEAFERIDELHRQGGKLRGLSTGFHGVDELLGGLQRSDLLILAARPSVGKTSLALDMARLVALRNKVSVGIFSLEMGKEQLVDRMLCAQARVGLWKMRTGRLSDSGEDNDFTKIGQAMGELAEAKIYIDDSSNTTIMDIRTKCRRLQIEKGLDFVVIDYLQLMEGRGKYQDNRVQEVSEISRGLKNLARELNIPVLALSQLSRTVEQSTPAIPKLAHLRESGSIEQDADIVMFIYRKAADRNYRREDLSEFDKHSAELHVAKHRNGPTGKIDLFFDDDTADFKNVDLQHELPPSF
ncbi:replicative DNA helicase [Candidatus Falkowbacteria bacterium]|nr:replicative DNA helicase [Candidatus Falkowbacteria bacterium]